MQDIFAVSTETMRASDQNTIECLTPSRELMYRAGKGIFESVSWQGPVGIICGKGNNAGDGYVLAALLKKAGIPVELLLFEETFSPDGKYYFDACLSLGIPASVWTKATDLRRFSEIADCLLGTGFSGEVRGRMADLIRAINESGAYIVSADINSGLNGNSGAGSTFVCSDLTVSIGTPKFGLFLANGPSAMKKMVNIDIGIRIMPPEKPFRFAIIGAGNIAGHFAEAVRMLPDAEVTAIGSKSPERAEAFAQKFNIPAAYGSYEEMLEKERPDGVYIATTPNFHYENAMLCLSKGLPFLCEKAAFLNSEAASRIFRLSEEKNIFTMEALWSRFLPSLRTAKDWLDSGRIGTPLSFTCNVGCAFDREKNRRNFDPVLAGGAMYDLTCYSYEIADFFFGKETKTEDISVLWENTGVDLSVKVLLRYGSVRGTLLNSCIENIPEELRIQGTNGVLVVPKPHYGNEVFLYDAEGNLKDTFDAGIENGFVFEIMEIMNRVREGKCESPVVPHALTERCAVLFDRLQETKPAKRL